MGLGYSDLHVYFRSRTSKRTTSEYIVTTTHKRYTGCSSFFERCHEIQFKQPADGLKHNILLYDSSSSTDSSNYVFGYYYPGNPNEVVNKVHVYYSVLAPEHPLVISFETKIKKYDCYFKRLKTARWNYASHITEYLIGKDLNINLLDAEFKKLSLKKTIKLITNSNKKDVTAKVQQLDQTYFRYIIIPNGVESELGCECLFSIDYITKEPKSPEANSSQKNNHIDPYFLHSFTGHFFDGIMVYFSREKPIPKPKREEKEYEGKAILLELINSSKDKIQMMRKDDGGYWWSEVKVECNTDTKLISKLSEIQTQLNKNVIIVILDEKKTYKGVQNVTTEQGTKAYMKYTHEFQTTNKPKLLFDRTEPKIALTETVTAQKVEVFYLKPKDAKDDDKEPFLIIFDPKGQEPKKKIGYHFANKYNFVDWKSFSFEENGQALEEDKLVEKLYKKVEKIGELGGCISDLVILRTLAYDILLDKEITATTVPPVEKPKKPDIVEPKPEPEPPPIWLIVGCVAAGVVLIVTSVVVYGIYWYNTTIKLLT